MAGEEQDIANFYLDKKTNKYRPECRSCHKTNSKIYRDNNKDKKKNSDALYYAKNKDSINEYKKNWHQENKESRKEKINIYRVENKDKILKQANFRKKERRKTDPVYKLRENVSSSIRIFLYTQNVSKKGISIANNLSYSFDELKLHIGSLFESWMNWENQGIYNINTWDDNDSSTWTWQLDHIIPQSKLPYTSMEDENFQKCWALENLRPYSAKQNIKDGNRR